MCWDKCMLVFLPLRAVRLVTDLKRSPEISSCHRDARPRKPRRMPQDNALIIYTPMRNNRTHTAHFAAVAPNSFNASL